MTVYSIRCFKDGKRKLTYKLTRREARIFREAARTLQLYLTKTYHRRECAHRRQVRIHRCVQCGGTGYCLPVDYVEG